MDVGLIWSPVTPSEIICLLAIFMAIPINMQTTARHI